MRPILKIWGIHFAIERFQKMLRKRNFSEQEQNFLFTVQKIY